MSGKRFLIVILSERLSEPEGTLGVTPSGPHSGI